MRAIACARAHPQAEVGALAKHSSGARIALDWFLATVDG